LAFPGDSRLEFETQILYPIAGLKVEDGLLYDKINRQQNVLNDVNTYVARHFIDGDINREEAIALLMKYHSGTRARAKRTLAFIETYRSYIINYTLGEDLVRDYIGRHADDNNSAWDAFRQLLMQPTTASDLILIQQDN